MKPLDRAEQNGLEAALAGKPVTACPYRVNPHGCHRRNAGTWGAVFRSRWMNGYREGQYRLEMMEMEAQRA